MNTITKERLVELVNEMNKVMDFYPPIDIMSDNLLCEVVTKINDITNEHNFSIENYESLAHLGYKNTKKEITIVELNDGNDEIEKFREETRKKMQERLERELEKRIKNKKLNKRTLPRNKKTDAVMRFICNKEDATLEEIQLLGLKIKTKSIEFNMIETKKCIKYLREIGKIQ